MNDLKINGSRNTHTHTHARIRTHAHTRADAQIHTHTHTRQTCRKTRYITIDAYFWPCRQTYFTLYRDAYYKIIIISATFVSKFKQLYKWKTCGSLWNLDTMGYIERLLDCYWNFAGNSISVNYVVGGVNFCLCFKRRDKKSDRRANFIFEEAVNLYCSFVQTKMRLVERY
jgi:hypothetical protein